MKPAGLSAGLLIASPDDSSCSRVLVWFDVFDSEFNANSAETLVLIEPDNITLLLARWPLPAATRVGLTFWPLRLGGPPWPAESRLPREDGRFRELLRKI